VPHKRHPPLEKRWALKAVSAPPQPLNPRFSIPTSQTESLGHGHRDVTSGEFRSASLIRSIDAKRAPTRLERSKAGVWMATPHLLLALGALTATLLHSCAAPTDLPHLHTPVSPRPPCSLAPPSMPCRPLQGICGVST